MVPKERRLALTPFQIHGRAKNYPQSFERDGSMISLKGSQTIKNPITSRKKAGKQQNLSAQLIDAVHIGSLLMNEESFKSAATIDTMVPDHPGIYCIRISDVNKLPKPFAGILKDRNHNIVYIGIASQSLNRRFLNQELRANGHGTFFRSIGAVLGYRPAKGSLLGMANKRNYTFTHPDERRIIDWINSNLTVNWVSVGRDFESIENGLIRKYLPLLNMAKNPAALNELKNLRAECVRIANSS